MGRHVPVIALMGLLIGCAWRGPVPVQTFPDVEPSSNVLALDKAAWKLVAIQKQQISREDDGRLKVALELANLSQLELNVQVQTIFRDKDDMLTGDETNFEMFTLPGNGSKLYEVTSMRPDAGSFTIQVKTP